MSHGYYIQDEVESVTTQHKQVYKNIQRENFARVGTAPEEWTPCTILDIVSRNGRDTIKFEIPDGYTKVYPYSESLSKEALAELQAVFLSNMMTGHGFTANCELCGHGIKDIFLIKNDNKKLLMQVGNVCIDTFMHAEYVTEVVTKFKETKLRKTVRAWKPLAITEIYTNPKFSEGGRQHRIIYKYWKFADTLRRKTNVDVLTTRKLINVLRKAKALGLNIPHEAEDMIQTKKERKSKAANSEA